MTSFEQVYREAWEAQLEGRAQEADACFEVAKRAAADAVRQGATADQLALSMRQCCLTLEERLGVQIQGSFL